MGLSTAVTNATTHTCYAVTTHTCYAVIGVTYPVCTPRGDVSAVALLCDGNKVI